MIPRLLAQETRNNALGKIVGPENLGLIFLIDIPVGLLKKKLHLKLEFRGEVKAADIN
jgi:hypothetical protein